MSYEFLQQIDEVVLLWFNGSDSLYLDNVVMAFTSGLTWIPLYVALLYLVIKNSENMPQFALIVLGVLVTMLLSDGLADYIAKPYVARWRPTNDPVLKYSIDVVGNYRETSYGFFSAHASNTMAVAIFFCQLVRNRALSLALVAWSLLSCWTRLYLGVHYPSDILVGLVWGCVSALIGYFCYRKIYFAIKPRLRYVSSQYTSTGYSHQDIDVVLLTMAVLLLYISFSPIIPCF